MITYLIEALQAAGLTPTAEELADLLWLASQMGTPTFVKAETALAKRQVRPAPMPPGVDNTQAATDDDQKKGADQTTSEENTQTGADVYLPPTGNQSGDEAGSGGLPFRSPGATGLPGALDIGRALRPLKRRVPARTQFSLDEEATVRRIVDMNMDNWLPVMRPAPARWLDVVLVVDEASSMVLWRQTIAEFRRILEQLGAFRIIQTLYILPDTATGQVFLSPDLRGSKARIDQRSAAELSDPRGRRLLLVLSDCVAPYWYGGEITHWLEQWGQEGLVALIHMLPQQLRLRTGLASAAAVHVRGHLPGLRNAQLEIEWTRRRRRNQQFLAGIPIPVVTLEPETLGPWARLLTGNGKQSLPAVVFPQSQTTDFHRKDLHLTALPEQLPPEKQVEQFLATASPLARELAGYLAAVPLSLPIMRLVQRVMLPEARQIHLAEVLLSGLIQQLTPYVWLMDSDAIRYDFTRGTRDQLLDTVLISDIEKVLDEVSKYISDLIGKTFDFKAWLQDPSSVNVLPINSEVRAFAKVSAETLQRLGGSYAKLSEILWRHIRPFEKKPTVEIMTKGGLKVRLDDTDGTIELVSKIGHKVILDDHIGKITIESQGNLEIKAAGSIKIEAGSNVNLQSNTIKVNGAIVDLRCIASMSIHAGIIALSGGGQPAARVGDLTTHGGVITMGTPTVFIGGQPAARVSDMHTCPMVTGLVPHVGGPIIQGSSSVIISGQPAARVGDIATCVGPPDTIALGCPTVLIGV